MTLYVGTGPFEFFISSLKLKQNLFQQFLVSLWPTICFPLVQPIARFYWKLSPSYYIVTVSLRLSRNQQITQEYAETIRRIFIQLFGSHRTVE